MKVEGSLFPQTRSIYHCSNQECQDEKEKQAEKRIKLTKDKEVADAARNEKKLQDKKLAASKALEAV